MIKQMTTCMGDVTGDTIERLDNMLKQHRDEVLKAESPAEADKLRAKVLADMLSTPNDTWKVMYYKMWDIIDREMAGIPEKTKHTAIPWTELEEHLEIIKTRASKTAHAFEKATTPTNTNNNRKGTRMRKRS